MKLSSFLFIAGLMVSALVFMSMAYKAQEASSVIDEVEVTDLSIPSTTVYFVERSVGSGSVVINGTQTSAPVPNGSGGKNYKCRVSVDICYQCHNCELVE